MSSALKRSGSTRKWREIRELVLARDGHLCQRCGAEGGLQVDHIHERQHGGDDSLDNLQTLCEICHKMKKGVFFERERTPPTPPVLLSPQKGQIGHHRTGSSLNQTESVSHG
jgi:hypothetical protein